MEKLRHVLDIKMSSEDQYKWRNHSGLFKATMRSNYKGNIQNFGDKIIFAQTFEPQLFFVSSRIPHLHQAQLKLRSCNKEKILFSEKGERKLQHIIHPKYPI